MIFWALFGGHPRHGDPIQKRSHGTNIFTCFSRDFQSTVGTRVLGVILRGTQDSSKRQLAAAGPHQTPRGKNTKTILDFLKDFKSCTICLQTFKSLQKRESSIGHKCSSVILLLEDAYALLPHTRLLLPWGSKWSRELLEQHNNNNNLS